MRDRQQIEKVAMRQREEKRQWTTGVEPMSSIQTRGTSQDQTKEGEKRDLWAIFMEQGRTVSGREGEGKAKEEGGKKK